MPGNEDYKGDYTIAELREMSREDFEAAQAREFAKPQPDFKTSLGIPFSVPVSGAQTASNFRGEIRIGTSVPARATAEPRSDVWSSAPSAGEDFVCPSGQTCKLRPLSPEKLLEAGILDNVTRLEGLADQLVSKAEGQPPESKKMPTPDEFRLLIETVNKIVPLAVAEPTVWPEPEEGIHRLADRIYIDSISLEDRMAIMDQALSGVKRLDSFRNS